MIDSLTFRTGLVFGFCSQPRSFDESGPDDGSSSDHRHIDRLLPHGSLTRRSCPQLVLALSKSQLVSRTP